MNDYNDNNEVLEPTNIDSLDSNVVTEPSTEASSAQHDELKKHLKTSGDEESQTLRDNVHKALRNYFAHVDGQPVTDVYQMVLSEVEAPLLETVMEYTRGNQTKASILLGLNRGTLRKKLKIYGLI
jgi:Fis family transcriptional regulator